ncbi:MAG: hypothetical protein C0469_15795 [Cyanobacteria bacterium DS2.3.42]|nr:hypothetical protein [Cyanobacteria bacterium DS2.3.42]
MVAMTIRNTANNKVALLSIALSMLTQSVLPVKAQRDDVDKPRGGDGDGVVRTQPPVYVPPKIDPPRLTIPTPPTVVRLGPPILVPTDATNPTPQLGAAYNIPSLQLPTGVSGLIPMKINEFPKEENSKDKGEWVLVRAEQKTHYSRSSPISVELSVGAVLVSVRRPSQTAFVKTELGKVAITANGDAIIKNEDGVLRVMNIDGMGKSVRVKLEGGPFVGNDTKVVGLKPGFELVAGSRLLKRNDLKPKDGIGRRKASVVLKGYAAVNQFSVDTLMQSCDLVVAINQNVTGVKERRILSDMSKMAAVLNMMDTAPGQGFVREVNYKLAQTDHKTQ